MSNHKKDWSRKKTVLVFFSLIILVKVVFAVLSGLEDGRNKSLAIDPLEVSRIPDEYRVSHPVGGVQGSKEFPFPTELRVIKYPPNLGLDPILEAMIAGYEKKKITVFDIRRDATTPSVAELSCNVIPTGEMVVIICAFEGNSHTYAFSLMAHGEHREALRAEFAVLIDRIEKENNSSNHRFHSIATPSGDPVEDQAAQSDA